jgi:RecB family exonuclease
VTGFNEGIVPSSLNADAFLPNELRRHLRLNDNARRYARDAYALCVLAQSRRELKIVAGRRTVDGDPLVPSRLLFACHDEELPHRVLRLLKPAAPPLVRPVFAGSLVPGREQPAFDVPRPASLGSAVESMRVTEFSDYLRCPYRYYLKQRLRLQAIDTAAEELDGLGFGSLLHGVLERFGKSDEIRSSTRPDEIAAFLDEALEEIANPLRRTTLQPALGVQIEQARLRLRSFAKWQADWAASGWRIICTEADIKDEHGAVLLVDGVPMALRGRIDRIDVRETASGLEFVLFDYKTGDAGKTPDQTHRKQGEWIDLQLPLYRHLVRALEKPAVDGPVQLGYILLPRDIRRAGGQLAGWSPVDLAEADRVAEHVVRQIRREAFWPRSPEPTGDEFAAICQEQLLGAAVEEEGEAAAGGE